MLNYKDQPLKNEGGIYYVNIQSLYKNKNQLEIFIEEVQPDIIMLSETHITKEIEECEVAISGYNLIQCYSHSRHTGGVAVYVRNKIKYSVLDSISIADSIWMLSIDVKFETKPLICTVLYHSPSASDAYFLKKFDNWLKDNINYENVT